MCASTLNIAVGTHSSRGDNSSLSDNVALVLVSSTISYRALKLWLWPRMCLAGSTWNGVPCIYSCEESIRGLLRWAHNYYNYKISSWCVPTVEEKWKVQLFKKLPLALLNHASVLLSHSTYSSTTATTTCNCGFRSTADGIHLSGWRSVRLALRYSQVTFIHKGLYTIQIVQCSFIEIKRKITINISKKFPLSHDLLVHVFFIYFFSLSLCFV